MDWRHLAACRGMDPEQWFPTDEGKGRESVGAQAPRAVCAGCPVREQCLAWALRTGQDDGVWGGLTSPERRALRSGRLRRSPHRRSRAGVDTAP
jgi:WhiB family redox-sensing transcriptional regulator